MKFIVQNIPEIILVEPAVKGDDRGYFVETFRQDLLEKALGHSVNFVQDNESKSLKGVLRGLHYQSSPFSQAKLVKVVQGSVLDVVVDIRKLSPSFGQHVAVELTEENKRQLFVPHGFAHGFVVLSESATFCYKVDNYYSPEHERGIAFDDVKLGIDWKLSYSELRLSDKDKSHPYLADAKYLF